MLSGGQDVATEKLFYNLSKETPPGFLKDAISQLKTLSAEDKLSDEERRTLAKALRSLKEKISYPSNITPSSMSKKQKDDTTSYLLPTLALPGLFPPLAVAQPVSPSQVDDTVYREVLGEFPTIDDPMSLTSKLLNRLFNQIIRSASDAFFQEKFNEFFDEAIKRIPSVTTQGTDLYLSLNDLKTKTWEAYQEGKLSKELTLATAMSADKFTKVIINETINDEDDLIRARKAIDEFRSETHHLQTISKELALLATTAAAAGVGYLIAGPAGAIIGGIIGWTWGLWYINHKKEIKETASKADDFVHEKSHGVRSTINDQQFQNKLKEDMDKSKKRRRG